MIHTCSRRPHPQSVRLALCTAMLTAVPNVSKMAASAALRTCPATRRSFAHVSDRNRNVKVPHMEPFILEDIAAGMSPTELKKLPQFTISRQHGFLPREDPLVQLPKSFDALDSLLNRMTIKQYDAQGRETEPGLLATCVFGDAVKDELKVGGIEDQAVDSAIAEGDQRLLSALFRDYCFA